MSIDNLPETELKAVLEEAVKYRGKGDQQTELFQALLRETQESGEESPPAFRPTQSSQTFLTSSQQRKRRQKGEFLLPWDTTVCPVQHCGWEQSKGRLSPEHFFFTQPKVWLKLSILIIKFVITNELPLYHSPNCSNN